MRLFTIILAWLIGCAAAAPDPRVVERELRARYDSLGAAYGRGDVESVLAFRTADFHGVGADGRHLDAETMERATRGWFALNCAPVRVRFQIRDLRVQGDEAMVTVLQQITRGPCPAGEGRQDELHVIQDETWRRTPAGWRIARHRQVITRNVGSMRIVSTRSGHTTPDTTAIGESEEGN